MYIRFIQLAAPPLLCFLMLPGICFSQTTELVSVNSLGIQGNGNHLNSSISGDGRYVAFQSSSTNFVQGWATGYWNIYVHDRQTGVTECVSVDSFGLQGIGHSEFPSITRDGRYVAFSSRADSLVSGDTNSAVDAFIHDRQTGVTERISVDSLGVQGNDWSGAPAISADGRFVAFESGADNLVPGDTNGLGDIFIHDRQSGVTKRVSVDSLGGQASDWSDSCSISSTGRFVGFRSLANNLVPGDTNHRHDVFVHDCQTGITERVSVNSFGVEGNHMSSGSSLSADGRYVTFQSGSTNLVPGNAGVFVHDRQSGVTECMNVDSRGLPGSGISYDPSISADGRHVTFTSTGSSLVPGGDDYYPDIFVRDRQTGVTECVSVNSRGVQGRGASSTKPAISEDGRYVVFESHARNLVSGFSPGQGIFLRDRWSGLGINSIFLKGPSTSPVLAPVDFFWQTTRGSSQYWLAYSQNKNGTILRGHHFEIGAPTIVLATGTNSINGLGSFTTAPIPLGAAGLTIYFEVAARDAGGIIYDSNLQAVTFY